MKDRAWLLNVMTGNINRQGLESILSQLYEIVQTAYTATAGEDAVPSAAHVLAHDYKYPNLRLVDCTVHPRDNA